MDKVIAIDKLVLDPEKLTDAPPLFRVKEALDEYVFDETLTSVCKERRFTNLRFQEIDQQPGSAS
jgi:hypothetical protein